MISAAGLRRLATGTATTALVARVVAHARRHPDAPALIQDGRITSYAELVALADTAAARLAGLPPGPVGILARKTPRAIGAILGVLVAGRGCFIPTPGLPPAVLRTVCDQAGCVRVLAVDTADEVAPGGVAPGGTPGAGAGAGAVAGVAFLLTTSGSTGTPKIVPITGGAVDRFAGWVRQRFEVGPGRCVLSYAPLHFDLCLFDIWATLAHGATVLLVDPDETTGGRLLELLAARPVHVIEAVPLLYELLVAAADGRRLEHPRHVLVTGDTIRPGCLAELPRLFPNARLYTLYGCTETNDSFLHEVVGAPNGAPLPLGEPLPGVAALLVDRAGRPVTGPGLGELYVSTPFQSAGYLGATAPDRFVPHPEGADDRRYFRSGDLVRRHPDGRLTLAGRTDFQVKIRGQRVNLQEVERVLLDHDDVLEAIVLAVSAGPAGRQLRAVVRRRPASRLTALDLRAFAAARLPAAAIPGAVRIGEDPLPRTATGKPDRTRIAAAEGGGPAGKEPLP